MLGNLDKLDKDLGMLSPVTKPPLKITHVSPEGITRSGKTEKIIPVITAPAQHASVAEIIESMISVPKDLDQPDISMLFKSGAVSRNEDTVVF